MFEVTIVYKSGYVHRDIFKEFTVERTPNGKIAGMKWERCRLTKYQILSVGIDDVEAIFSKKYSWWYSDL